jgi:hypothetical protein
MYRELSSEDESFGTSLFVGDVNTARTSRSPSRNDDEFTPNSTGSTSRKGVPSKKKKESEKPPKPRKPRLPKDSTVSPSKTLVNKFKKSHASSMVRTNSENPLAGAGGSSMARVTSI